MSEKKSGFGNIILMIVALAVLIYIPISIALIARKSPGTVANTGKETANPGATFKADAKYDAPADMSGYRFLKSGQGAGFVLESMQTANYTLEHGTGLIYFGFEGCKWCQRAVPVLSDVADNENMAIMYVDLASIDDEDQFDKLKSITSDYLDTDDDGKKVFYTPMVIAVKDGKIQGAHVGTVDSFTIEDENSNLNDEQYKELYEIYDKLAKAVE